MGHPEMRLLYTTPETLLSDKYHADFERCYRQKQLVRMVIDEVSTRSCRITYRAERYAGSCH